MRSGKAVELQMEQSLENNSLQHHLENPNLISFPICPYLLQRTGNKNKIPKKEGRNVLENK